jgi:hypothetical protein
MKTFHEPNADEGLPGGLDSIFGKVWHSNFSKLLKPSPQSRPHHSNEDKSLCE